MKKFVIFLSIILIGFLTYQYIPGVRHLLSYSPCDTPITYKLGSIDPRFELSDSQVLTDTKEAAAIWNNSLNKNIFTYDPEGEITINLIYDKRQELSTEINNLQKKLDADKGNLDPQIEEYKRQSANFDQSAASLNQDIAYWNNRGGAPQDEYDKLITRQNELRSEAKNLNELARTLNQSAVNYNSQIGQLNQTEGQFTKTLVQKPEEGLFNGNDKTISIYFNNSQDELIHTLAHELGHARGLDHNASSESIMYPSSTEDITPSNTDLSSLLEVCKERSYVHLIILNYTNLVRQLNIKFQTTSN